MFPAPPVCVVVGAGPGIGYAVARRFALEGHRIAFIARNHGKLVDMKKVGEIG